MPEMLFRVRWPDRRVTEFYSPSRSIAAHLQAGATYTLADFVRRSRAGLTAASERVRAVHGMPCSRAAAELAAIERLAAGQDPAALVLVETMTISGDDA